MPDENPSIEAALQLAIATSRSIREPGKVAETFWFSSLSMCPRKVIAERAGLPPTNPPDMRSGFKMWAGTTLGRGIAHHLETVGYLDPAWTEKRVVYKSFSGKIDGLTHRINGSAIVEVKTVDDNSLKYPTLPEHYLWQSMGYALAANIPTVVIFMIGRLQGLSKNRVFHLDDEWRQKIDTEIARLDGLWELYQLHQVLPGHDHRYGWENKFCSMLENVHTVNKEDVDGTVAI